MIDSQDVQLFKTKFSVLTIPRQSTFLFGYSIEKLLYHIIETSKLRKAIKRSSLYSDVNYHSSSDNEQDYFDFINGPSSHQSTHGTSTASTNPNNFDNIKPLRSRAGSRLYTTNSNGNMKGHNHSKSSSGFANNLCSSNDNNGTSANGFTDNQNRNSLDYSSSNNVFYNNTNKRYSQGWYSTASSNTTRNSGLFDDTLEDIKSTTNTSMIEEETSPFDSQQRYISTPASSPLVNKSTRSSRSFKVDQRPPSFQQDNSIYSNNNSNNDSSSSNRILETDDDGLCFSLTFTSDEVILMCASDLMHRYMDKSLAASQLIQDVLATKQEQKQKDKVVLLSDEYVILQIICDGDNIGKKILELTQPLSKAKIPIFLMSNYFSELILIPVKYKEHALSIISSLPSGGSTCPTSFAPIPTGIGIFTGYDKISTNGVPLYDDNIEALNGTSKEDINVDDIEQEVFQMFKDSGVTPRLNLGQEMVLTGARSGTEVDLLKQVVLNISRLSIDEVPETCSYNEPNSGKVYGNNGLTDESSNTVFERSSNGTSNGTSNGNGSANGNMMNANGSRSSVYSIASLGDNSSFNLNGNSNNNVNGPTSSMLKRKSDRDCFPTFFAVTRTPSEEVGLLFESGDIKKLGFKKSQLRGSLNDICYPLTVSLENLIMYQQQEKEQRNREQKKTMMKLLDKNADGLDGKEREQEKQKDKEKKKKKKQKMMMMMQNGNKIESERDQRMSPQKKMLLQMQQVAYGEEPVPCFIEDTIDDTLDDDGINENDSSDEVDDNVIVVEDEDEDEDEGKSKSKSKSKSNIPHHGGEMKGIIAGIANRLVCHLGLEQLSYISMVNCCIVLIPDNFVKTVEEMLNQL
ncbi:unnamed protein product [Ambrosiozyma monospora]|uniref:Unnamed protein product n=1 Tax=Ambrosiozyma monospora TaxID=43982 RepID=A0A9W6YY14_AMBMO|nr:unnamed protein product [Ambrosiozyma monospora]